MSENIEAKQDKSDIILNSAEELMCKMSNPESLTVDMIAKNAGIGKGSIYYYFKSKEEIIDAVIERCYSNAIVDYFSITDRSLCTLEKIKMLFRSILKKEFKDSSKNILIYLHVQDDLVLHHKMMMTAMKTVTPILTELLKEGQSDGSIQTAAPRESAEMIVGMLTFLLDNSVFPSDSESMYRKLKLYAQVLETCLKAENGSFDFLFTPFDGQAMLPEIKK